MTCRVGRQAAVRRSGYRSSSPSVAVGKLGADGPEELLDRYSRFHWKASALYSSVRPACNQVWLLR